MNIKLITRLFCRKLTVELFIIDFEKSQMVRLLNILSKFTAGGLKSHIAVSNVHISS